jgi:arylformamidase
VIQVEHRNEIPIGELDRARIKPGERVLFRTRNSEKCWEDQPFQEDFVAIHEEAAQWLAERKPLLIGVDYLSIAPYNAGGPTHRAILGAGIWVIEGLDLSKTEAGDYEMICLPLKLAGAEGAPARVALRRV